MARNDLVSLFRRDDSGANPFVRGHLQFTSESAHDVPFFLTVLFFPHAFAESSRDRSSSIVDFIRSADSPLVTSLTASRYLGSTLSRRSFPFLVSLTQ